MNEDRHDRGLTNPGPLSAAEMQLEAIRGVLEELLTSSPTADPRPWAMNAIGQIGHILDMDPLEVMGVLVEQEKKRNG